MRRVDAMQLRHIILKVEDQDRALAFYTQVLGFKKAKDRRGKLMRWLSVHAPQGASGVELVLEPASFAPARKSQKALYDGGFPAAILTTNKIEREYQRLKDLGVKFRMKPRKMGSDTCAFFEDTVGNIIVLLQRRR
jgi:catechol 2,3-dioxygenase-like lactoylglutathione lyase family enzyme